MKLERWDNVSGDYVDQLTSNVNYPWSPSQTDVLNSFEYSSSPNGANYGSRLRALITIPEDGAYTFYISGDDAVELYLNENGVNFRGASLIARTSGWTHFREWTKNSSQQSQVCLLYTSPSPRDYAASRMPSSA